MILEVGKPYNPRRLSWPEGAQYNYRADTHELVLLWPRPTAREVRNAKAGPISLGLLVEFPAIFLLYRVGARAEWSDACYTWHLVPERERTLPADTGLEERRLLQVCLVDAASGILRALRIVTMSPDLTRQLHTAIREQAALPWQSDAYGRHVEAVYRRYPHSRDMARAASIVETAGAI